jgi:cardiolipin synthase (CMP-forming)
MAGPNVGGRVNLPNLITIFRLLLVPTVIYLIVTGELFAAFWVFVIAGISDGVDGFIAKRFNQATELGAYLDPLADKALLVSIFVSLGFLNEMPLWLVMLVVSRDLFIVSAVMLSWMLTHPVKVAPLMVSKANTTSQIVLAAVVLADLGFGLEWVLLREILVYLVAILTVLSAIAYLVAWIRHMNGGVQGEGTGSPDGRGT